MAEKIRVLYVDDEPPLLDLCKTYLERSRDFTVTTAISAPEAIQILGQERFDAIVSDFQMPEMDGIMAEIIWRIWRGVEKGTLFWFTLPGVLAEKEY